MKQYVFHASLTFFLSSPENYIQNIAKALNISNIEAKEHIKSHMEISLGDATNICNYFKVSMDELLEVKFETKTFRQFAFYYNIFTINDFWGHLDREMRFPQSINKTNSVYLAADIPVFYLFRFPELTAFKFYYWAVESYHQKSLKQKEFDLDFIDLDLVKAGYKIWNNYARMDSIEIWGAGIVNKLLQQVERLMVNEKISFKADIKFILEQCIQLLNEVEVQAETNQKVNFNIEPGRNNYSLYFLDTEEIPNMLLLSQDDKNKKVFQVYYTLDHLLIEDLNFCNHAEHWLKRFMLHANPLSGPANFKRREDFFNCERRKITNFIAKHNL